MRSRPGAGSTGETEPPAGEANRGQQAQFRPAGEGMSTDSMSISRATVERAGFLVRTYCAPPSWPARPRSDPETCAPEPRLSSMTATTGARPAASRWPPRRASAGRTRTNRARTGSASCRRRQPSARQHTGQLRACLEEGGGRHRRQQAAAGGDGAAQNVDLTRREGVGEKAKGAAEQGHFEELRGRVAGGRVVSVCKNISPPCCCSRLLL
jgi:hypothetical protein